MYGYIKAGADTVTPFKGEVNRIESDSLDFGGYMGSGTDFELSGTLTFNVSEIIPNYQKLSANNFVMNYTKCVGGGAESTAIIDNVTYNNNTGIASATWRVYAGTYATTYATTKFVVLY